MGTEATFQAIPEDCELLARARADTEVAELMAFFNSYAIGRHPFGWQPKTSAQTYFNSAVKALIQQRPGLVQRYLYAGRKYDMIVYLLSEERRKGNRDTDTSLIHKAIWGSERLHPVARATQGLPIGLVPAQDVVRITEFISTITYDHFHQHYKPPEMEKMGVYKIYAGDGEEVFSEIWDEFQDIRRFYNEATANNEAAVTVID